MLSNIFNVCVAKNSRSGTSRLGNKYGFTLIEIMVVIVILGILATLIVPRIMERPDEARRTKAALDIKSIMQAVELYRLDNRFYPTTSQGMQALIIKPTTAPVPTNWKKSGYLKKMPMDPWANPYIYLSPGLYNDFDVLSYGVDGVTGGEENNADIVSWELE